MLAAKKRSFMPEKQAFCARPRATMTPMAHPALNVSKRKKRREKGSLGKNDDLCWSPLRTRVLHRFHVFSTILVSLRPSKDRGHVYGKFVWTYACDFCGTYWTHDNFCRTYVELYVRQNVLQCCTEQSALHPYITALT